ncbi:MAG TPA: kelch repeat-containing protein [Candidatus Deferrimicrobium sp.]|nr:kelch repeat-containing protein [Candidatus Deferrimicrobium sp.]
MPTKRFGLAAVALGGSIYAISGDSALGGYHPPYVERYDPLTDSWTTMAPLPTARYGVGATVLNGQIYAIGGQLCSGGVSCFSGNVEVYDPQTNTWSARASMPTPRSAFGVVTLGGKIYAVGGYQQWHNPEALNIVEMYDPVTDTWTTKSPLHIGRDAMGCVALGGRIIAFGGYDGTPGGITAATEVYDPLTDSWAFVDSMPNPCAWYGVSLLDGKAYIVGGIDRENHTVSTLQRYDPVSNTWAIGDPMPTARHACAMAEANGTLYVLGGITQQLVILAAVESYTMAAIPILTVNLDIKPGSCPNPLNVGRNGVDSWDQNEHGGTVARVSAVRERPRAVLPVALVGTGDVDVADIDPSSVELLGVSALRWSTEDVTTPLGPDADSCECTTAGPDGYPDLSLKFDRGAIVAAVGNVHDGDVISLTISGRLYDGTRFKGNDCVVIRGSTGTLDGLEGQNGASETVSLNDNYPNPFNPATEISFSLPTASRVTLEVYNITGQKVATLVDRFMEAGVHSVTWDGSNAASGVYLYRMQTGDYVATRKMLLVK